MSQGLKCDSVIQSMKVIRSNPVGIWCQKDVVSTSMRRLHGALMLTNRPFYIMYPQSLLHLEVRIREQKYRCFLCNSIIYYLFAVTLAGFGDTITVLTNATTGSSIHILSAYRAIKETNKTEKALQSTEPVLYLQTNSSYFALQYSKCFV